MFDEVIGVPAAWFLGCLPSALAFGVARLRGLKQGQVEPILNLLMLLGFYGFTFVALVALGSGLPNVQPQYLMFGYVAGVGTARLVAVLRSRSIRS